jgi:competence protein ComEC
MVIGQLRSWLSGFLGKLKARSSMVAPLRTRPLFENPLSLGLSSSIQALPNFFQLFGKRSCSLCRYLARKHVIYLWNRCLMLPKLAGGFALGIYLASLHLINYPLLLLVPLCFFWREAWAALLGILFGALLFSLHLQTPPSTLALFAQDGPREALLEGEVISGPAPAFAADGTERRKLDLQVTQAGPAPGTTGDWQALSGGLRITLDGASEGLALGDYVRAWVTISPLPAPQNSQEVDSRPRLYAQGIDAVAYCRGLTVLGQSRATGISWMRAKVARSLERTLSASSRAVMGALIIGEPGSLPPELRARFAATGTAHLLAVSGGHVVIVAVLIEWLLGFLWLRSSWLSRYVTPPRGIAAVSFFGVVGYVVFVGASPSALRAGLAMGLLLFCKALGRTVSGVHIVSISALLALSIEPLELFGPSLQLSFAAVIGLGLFTPALKKKLSFSDWEKHGKPKALVWLWGSLRDLFIATLAATLATSPIVAWHFSQAAPASLLANLALVPLVSFILLPLGLLGAVFAIVDLSFAADLCFASSSWLWGWLEALLYWISPARPMDSPLYALALMLLYALLLGLFFLPWRLRFPVVLILAASCWLAYWAPLSRDGILRITFLSIGQGDSALIETPDGKNILVDGGGAAAGHDDPGARAILPFLRWRGVSSLDLMVLSHPHPDHFGGLASVAEELQVKNFWHNGGASSDPRFQRLVKATSSVSQTPQDGPMPYSGFVSDWGAVWLRMLGPAHQEVARPYEDENDNSLVFQLVYQNRSVLFTGDAEAIAEESMLASGLSLRSDVLKVGHHGSRSSTTDAFLDAVHPQSVVLCLGKKNRYGFPHQEVSARFTQRQLPVWRTDAGAVILETNGDWLRLHQNVPRTFAGELWPF